MDRDQRSNGYHNIAVIGAGPSGLVAAKYLRQKNFKFTVFEKGKKLGGTWNLDRGYPGLTVQSVKKAYCYTDFPYKKSTSRFPTHAEVYEYLSDYAKKFNLYASLELETEILSMERNENLNGWDLLCSNNESKIRRHFDFVIIANGVFNKIHIPRIENKEVFQGKIIHASSLTNLDMLQGNNIVVVGAGKSGLHLSTFIKSKTKKNVSLIFRSGRKIIPKKLFHFIPYNHFFFSPYRAVVRPYDHLGIQERIVYSIMKPLNRITTFIIKFASKWQLALYKKHLADLTQYTYNGCGALLVPDYYKDEIDKINIYPHKEIKKYNVNSIVLSSHESIKADTIIYATGYEQSLSFLPKDKLSKIADDDKQIWLYKHVLHPDLPDAAFSSYAIGMNSVLNSEICAQWITDYLLNKINLPTPELMRKIINVQKKYYQSSRYKNSIQSSCVTPSDYFWIRDMLTDMGKKKKLKYGNLITEYLFSGYSKDYHSKNIKDINCKSSKHFLTAYFKKVS